MTLLQDTDGTIPLPTNALKVTKVKYSSDNRTLHTRGRRIYDNRKNTFILDGPVKVDMVIALPFEDFPDPIKAWVVALAGLRWCRPKLPSGAVFAYTSDYARDCEMAALQYEVDELGDETLRDTSPHFALFSRGRP